MALNPVICGSNNLIEVNDVSKVVYAANSQGIYYQTWQLHPSVMECGFDSGK